MIDFTGDELLDELLGDSFLGGLCPRSPVKTSLKIFRACWWPKREFCLP
jgi:hypothetical protein